MSCQQEELACRIPFSFQPCQKYTPAPVGEMKPKWGNETEMGK